MKSMKKLTVPLFFSLLLIPIISGDASFGVSKIAPDVTIEYPKLVQVARVYNEGNVTFQVKVGWVGVKADNSTMTLHPYTSESITFNADKAGTTYKGSLVLTANYPKGPGANPVVPESIVQFTITVLAASSSGGIGIETIYLAPAIIIGLIVAAWRLR